MITGKSDRQPDPLLFKKCSCGSPGCPKWLEYTLVYIGSWVGMAGPISMLVQHDVRDWAQRQPRCHDYFMHGANLVKDGWWQLNCDFRLAHAPRVVLEGRVGKDSFYTWLEKT